MRRALRALAVLTALGSLSWVLRHLGVFGGDPWDPVSLRSWVQQAGAWGPLVFLLVAVLKPLLVPQPIGLAWLAGALFGVTKGGVLVALSGLGSCFVGYAVGFWAAGKPDRRVDEVAATAPGGALASVRWQSVALLRATVPWDFVSYWAGARRYPMRPYLTGTVLALLPVSFGYAYAANSLVEGQGRHLLLAIPLILGLLFGPLWFFDRRRNRGGR